MQDQPATITAQLTFERIRIKLKGTRGPINYTDLAGDEVPEPPHEELGSDNEMDVEVQPGVGPPPVDPEPQAAPQPLGAAAAASDTAAAACAVATSGRSSQPRA